MNPQLIIVDGTFTREHVSTEDTLAHEHVSTQRM